MIKRIVLSSIVNNDECGSDVRATVLIPCFILSCLKFKLVNVYPAPLFND